MLERKINIPWFFLNKMSVSILGSTVQDWVCTWVYLTYSCLIILAAISPLLIDRHNSQRRSRDSTWPSVGTQILCTQISQIAKKIHHETTSRKRWRSWFVQSKQNSKCTPSLVWNSDLIIIMVIHWLLMLTIRPALPQICRQSPSIPPVSQREVGNSSILAYMDLRKAHNSV